MMPVLRCQDACRTRVVLTPHELCAAGTHRLITWRKYGGEMNALPHGLVVYNRNARIEAAEAASAHVQHTSRLVNHKDAMEPATAAAENEAARHAKNIKNIQYFQQQTRFACLVVYFLLHGFSWGPDQNFFKTHLH
jgi:hypothetical protein